MYNIVGSSQDAIVTTKKLVGGFKYLDIFIPIPWEMIQFDDHIFQRGWFNHQLEKLAGKGTGLSKIRENFQFRTSEWSPFRTSPVFLVHLCY